MGKNLKSKKGTIKELKDDEAVFEGFDNGVSYDESGRLREHQYAQVKGCHLITACIKNKLNSLGTVSKIRKIILKFENQ